MPQKFIKNITAHCSLFSSHGADLLPANIKHNIQLHLLTTASVLNIAMAMIVSIDVNKGGSVLRLQWLP